MSTKLSKEFDIQDYLINTEKDSKAFFKACIEEDPGDRPLKADFVRSVPPRRISKIRDNI